MASPLPLLTIRNSMAASRTRQHAGGDDGFQHRRVRPAAVTLRYSAVDILGDFMGATAALMCENCWHSFNTEVCA